MQRTGTLTISLGVSRLPEIRLARDTANPLKDATSFLRGKGFDTGDQIKVTGSDGLIGNGAVFFITSAVAAP